MVGVTDPPPANDDRPLPAWPGVAAAAAIGLVYLLVASGGTFRFTQSSYPHHILIADAWLHGQLNVREEVLRELVAPYYQSLRAQIEASMRAQGQTLTEQHWQQLLPSLPHAPWIHDWIFFNGKYYGYWGPMPAAMLLPYVAVVGLRASDRLAGCLVGAGTALLTYLMLREAARRRLLDVSPATGTALAIVLGLGTVHFYLSVMGQVWFLSQVTATFFLTLAVWATLRCDRGVRWAAVGGAAFGCAVLSRSSMLTTGPFFLIALLCARGRPRLSEWRALAPSLATFAAPVTVAAALLLAYNHARFGYLFEDGVRYQSATGANVKFKELFDRYGIFNLHYVPHNVYYYFLNIWPTRHPFTGALTFDPEGNSMLLVTPPLLFVFRAFRRRNWLTVAAAAGAGVCLATLMCFFGTGWYNFGNRYLLDLMPMAVLLMAAGMGRRLTPTAVALIALSLIANAWGTYRFQIEQP